MKTLILVTVLFINSMALAFESAFQERDRIAQQRYEQAKMQRDTQRLQRRTSYFMERLNRMANQHGGMKTALCWAAPIRCSIDWCWASENKRVSLATVIKKNLVLQSCQVDFGNGLACLTVIGAMDGAMHATCYDANSNPSQYRY